MQFPFSSRLSPIEFTTRFCYHPSMMQGYTEDKGYLNYLNAIKEDFMYEYDLFEKPQNLRNYNKKLALQDGDTNELQYIENRAKRMEQLYDVYTDIVLTVTSYLYNKVNHVTIKNKDQKDFNTVLEEEELIVKDFDNLFKKGKYTIEGSFNKAMEICLPIKQAFDKMVDLDYPMTNFSYDKNFKK
ncbi:hypothetical protein HN451_04390 [archaeon]|jgi:hypothetical protein|nr:hypothetical protein [archaeon]